MSVDSKDSTSNVVRGSFRSVNDQVRSRDRVRNLAEVLTHEREVKAMLDLVPEMFPTHAGDKTIDRTFFEPAVGTGNFIEEILRRKLKYVDYDRGSRRVGRASRPFLFDMMRAVASIYAVDIDQSNVDHTKDRIRWIVRNHVDQRMNTLDTRADPYRRFVMSMDVILDDNIKVGNTLTDMGHLLWVSYRPSTFTFRRTWSVAGSDRVVKRDASPVNYNSLHHQANRPVMVDRQERVA